MPFLALFGLRRLPNLVVVVTPYAVSVPLVLTLAERFEPATEAGLVGIALAPGALLAPAVLNAAGIRRADMAGALVLGTVILSFLLVVFRASTTTLAITAAQAFVIASSAAGAMPTVRDRLLAPLRWIGHAAGAGVLGLALASAPWVDAPIVLAAMVLAAFTIGVAGAVALILRRDPLSAIAGAGTRDPIVATALAWSLGGPEATALPLVTAAILGIVAAAMIVRRR